MWEDPICRPSRLGDCRQAFRGLRRLLHGARAHHLMDAALPPLGLPSFPGLSGPHSSHLLALSLHKSCWSTEQGQKLPTGQRRGQVPFIPTLASHSGLTVSGTRQKDPLYPCSCRSSPFLPRRSSLLPGFQREQMALFMSENSPAENISSPLCKVDRSETFIAQLKERGKMGA